MQKINRRARFLAARRTTTGHEYKQFHQLVNQIQRVHSPRDWPPAAQFLLVCSCLRRKGLISRQAGALYAFHFLLTRLEAFNAPGEEEHWVSVGGEVRRRR